MSGLTKLHIGAYRSLRDVDLDGFGRMNLLVGGNNAGKTSILEAIGLLARPFDPAQWVQTVLNRDSSGSVLDGLWGLFPGSTAIALDAGDVTSQSTEVCGSFGDAVRTLTAHASAYIEQWSEVERTGSDTEVEAQLDIVSNVAIPNMPDRDHTMEFHSTAKRVAVGAGVPQLRVFVVTPVTHRSAMHLVTQLSAAINSGAKAQSLELLRLFDPDIDDVLISRSIDRQAIRVDHQKNGIVDLSTFGDGMRRAFAMSLALARASGGILLIDELESTIHARALDFTLPWLVRAAEVADVQIVATTHSLEAVDAVLGAFEDKDSGVVAYYLRRTDTGLACRHHDLKSLRNFRSEGLDIR